MTEQHIPIFVGSTYLDLKEYRSKVHDTLTRMETYVHGMEQFGARPGSPVDECLAEVRKCKIYIGIFAMRYGSIPDGYEKSMTELEYDEAQRLGLPSYIFVIDEKKAKVTPADIDFAHQKQLNALKEKLTSRHMVEYFTSPDDLANKVGAAIHRALRENKTEKVVIEKGIETVLATQNPIPLKALMRRFEVFPKRWAGTEISVSLLNYYPNNTNNPPMMDIEEGWDCDYKMFGASSADGDLISCGAEIVELERRMVILAQGENAYAFIDTDYYARFYVRAKLMCDIIKRDEIILALGIMDVLKIEPDIPTVNSMQPPVPNIDDVIF